MKPTLSKLEQLVTAMPAPNSAAELFPIEVTDIFGQVNGEDTIFWFRKPVTSDLFALTDICAKIQYQFADFPDDLAENIALMSRCIQEEGLDADKAWLLLANIVKRTEDAPHKFLTFKARFMAKFPEAYNLAAVEVAQKKNVANANAPDVPVSDIPALPAGRKTRAYTRKRGAAGSV